MNQKRSELVIIGAGPSGMGCAHTLGKQGLPSLVIEKDDDVGGLCRTIDHFGYLFDIGGHRFLSKFKTINDLWHEILGSELRPVQRTSRIFYRNKFFKYPLSFFDTFLNLGVFESAKCMASFAYSRLTKPGDDTTFEGWIVNRFGRRLFEIFFDTYTTKVWAIPSKDISADWAVQRIRGLSLRVALKESIRRAKSGAPKTLAQEFIYPRKGPGQFYDRLREQSKLRGADYRLNNRVTAVEHGDMKITAVHTRDKDGLAHRISVDHLFSSMPLPQLIQSLDPAPPDEIIRCTEHLKFRSFLVVNVILDREDLFPDQWIYVHSPEVQMGRVQNYKNWSEEMTPNPKNTSLGLEYFCQENDALWNMNDAELIDFAVRELETIGLASPESLIDGFVVRRADVYPVYSLGYQEKRRILKNYLRGFENLTSIGRAGLFKYDNSDLAMLSGISAARNYLGESQHDLWEQKEDHEYLES